MLGAAIALYVGSTSARGQPPAKDLWQTYMDAARASDQSGDFTIEAVTLDAALAFAEEHDSHGQRPAFTRLPLILAYGELGRKDLMDPLAAQGLHIDISDLDERYDDYIQTIDNYASSYYVRWHAHKDDNPPDDFRQSDRFYGTKDSYLIDVALRTKLRPGDRIGLASAMSLSGLAYKNGGDFQCAGYEYGRASEMFKDFRQMLSAMTWAGGRFGVENPATAATQQGAIGDVDTQVYLLLAMGMNMEFLADKTLHTPAGKPSSGPADLTDCDNFGPPARTALPVGFDAQVSRAFDYYHAALELTGELREYWPTHPFFGLLSSRFADLYGLEFEMSKAHPEKYKDSLAKARRAYEDALAILTRAKGANSDVLHDPAADYVDLLVEVNLNDEAKKIEGRYGVKPSSANN